jgi:hypothetical protein
METPRYSEQDMQDYASGSYAGDLSAFEDYLEKNPAALAQVKQYQHLFSLVQNEAIPSLSFNLADKVISKTHQSKFAPEPALFKLLPYVLIVLGVLAAVLTLRYFLPGLHLSPSTDFRLLGASAIIMLIFLTAFYYVEIKHYYSAV